MLVVVAALAPRVLVIGGSGRVGGSTVRWLDTLAREAGIGVDLAVGGRSSSRFADMQERWRSQGASPDVTFRRVDIEDEASLRDALRDVDLVVHTAGPFQGKKRASVLEAAIERGNIAYVDVCDETELCRAVKELPARDRNVSALVSCGIWPGVSALMARDCLDKLDNDANVEFAFFTAGTGGAGPTIVSATFLLLVTPVLTFVDGLRVDKEAWTEPRLVDFGDAGRRTVRLLDCPDVFTVAQSRPLASCASRFATAPDVWNALFGAAKAVLPEALLRNRQAMQSLAVFSDPIVRLVDKLVGSANVMIVDARDRNTKVRARHYHEDLEAAVGIATAAFALELLQQQPDLRGVHWPAELDPQVRRSILQRVLDAPGTLDYHVTTSSAAR